GGDPGDPVVELGATGAADDDVGLLLHTVPVPPRHPGTRLVGEPAHAQLWRSQGLAREAPLDLNTLRADVANLVEVLLRPVGHLDNFGTTGLDRTATARRGTCLSSRCDA